MIYQDGQDEEKIHVASLDGREDVLTVPTRATLRGAERIGEGIVLLFSTSDEAIIWKADASQTLHHKLGGGAVSAWDPSRDEVLILSDPGMERAVSRFTTWNYQEQREKTGELTW